MKDDKMVLITHHLLESSISTYIMMTTSKIDYKDERLVMLLVDAKTHKPDSLAYP